MSPLEDGNVVSKEENHLDHASNVQGGVVLLANEFANMQIYAFISCIYFYKYDHKCMLSWFINY